ncbi:hypothetical protein [Bacillus sp. 03113]|uniref:hypothetical protein n=1 Tax=Bacillus sp. 03113 TaxID=2578211 RepID=UPI0015E880BD|nr:hypothetical protein [Bacillus sp. 03113]
MFKSRKILISLLVTSLLTVPFYAQAAQNEQQNPTGMVTTHAVTLEDAYKATENFILSKPHLHPLESGTLLLKEYLYDTDETLIGYYFEVEAGETKGYFITSAIDTIDPIMQYGIDGDLSETLSKKAPGEKAYYYGAWIFQFGQNGKDVKDKFEKAKTNTVEKIKQEGKLSTKETEKIEKAELKSIKKGTEKSPGWEALLEPRDAGLGYSIAATATVKVLAVDRIYQRSSGINNPGSACGATTGAMIMDYYHDVLGYSVRDNAYYGSWAALVNHLYNEMGSTWIGTSLSMWANGALTHVRHASSNWESSQYSDAVGNSSKFIAAIDSNDPAALRFDRFDAGGSVIEYHFVAGIGYDKDGSYAGDLHIAYKDPDNGSTNTGTHWLDWTADDDDFGFAFLY